MGSIASLEFLAVLWYNIYKRNKERLVRGQAFLRHTTGMPFFGIGRKQELKAYHGIDHGADFIPADFFHDCLFYKFVFTVTVFINVFLEYRHGFRIKGNGKLLRA